MSENAITIPTRALRQIFVGAIALLLIGVLILAAWQQRDRFPFLVGGAGEHVDRSTYQAVFLTGGQLYFGRLETAGGSYLLLRDVYYLPPTVDADVAQSNQLVKRGNEISGPQEPMIIPSAAVIFIENLRPDGQVMLAIQRFKSGAPGATSTPPTPPPVATAIATARPSSSPAR